MESLNHCTQKHTAISNQIRIIRATTTPTKPTKSDVRSFRVDDDKHMV